MIYLNMNTYAHMQSTYIFLDTHKVYIYVVTNQKNLLKYSSFTS